MGLLQNLAQGLATAAGADDTAAAIQKNKDDRRATQQEELHGRTKAIFDDVTRLQERRAALPAGSPELAGIDKSLHEHMQAFQDLYHPTKNPGALQHLGGFLRQHITGKAPAPAPPSNAVTPDRMAGLQASAAGTQAPDPYLSPDDLKKKARIAAGLDPAAVAPKEVATKYQPQLTETTDASGVKHYWRVPLEQGANPEEVNFQGEKVTPKGAPPKPVRAWKKGKDGRPVSVELDAQNHEIPGSENPNILPPASMTGRISTGYYHFVDENGQVHQVQETRTSSPMGGGGAAPPAPIKTPGEAKTRAAAVAPKGDNVIGTKDTPVQAKARKDYIDATKLSSIADQVEKNPNDAVNQKRLAVALERQAAGRFTTQALDYIIKAGWGNTIEQWMNNPSTGALPKDVMRQLIDGAHQNLKAAKDALDESLKGRGGNQSAPSSDSDIDDIVKALGKK